MELLSLILTYNPSPNIEDAYGLTINTSTAKPPSPSSKPKPPSPPTDPPNRPCGLPRRIKDC